MKRTAVVVTCLALAVAPSTALGQGSSTCQAYNPQLSAALDAGNGGAGCGNLGASPTIHQVTPSKPSRPKVSPTISPVTAPPPQPPALISIAKAPSSLPFTGLDLGLLVGGGLALLAVGFAVRRLSSSPTE